MGFKLRISLTLLLFLLLSTLFTQPVFADGFVHIYDPDMGWKLQNEDQQLSVINYENGTEKMILFVDINNLNGEKAAWIFPVPAGPDKISIDVIKGFPRLSGQDIKEITHDKISFAFSMIRLSQLYTFPLVLLTMFTGFTGKAGLSDINQDITVYEHIEKMGLTTELITAKDQNALYNYLLNKGLVLPTDLKTISDEYIGKEYSFVVSWISDVQMFKQEFAITNSYGNTINTLGVYITFPTDKIYFPLKPTSVYGSLKIPILIYVIGHVTPELYPEIQKDTQINYFSGPVFGVPDDMSSFFGSKYQGNNYISDLEYTKIKIETPSKSLTEDLWIKNSAPIGVVLTDFINSSVWIWGIAFFILSSCLASMFAGMVIFRNNQPSKKKFALLGLWNFLTLIGFAIKSNKIGIDKTSDETKGIATQKVSFEKVIKITLLITFIISFLIFTLPLWFSILSGNFSFSSLYFGLSSMFALLLFPFVVWSFLIFIFILPFVWSYYKSKKITKFIVLFSVFFLIITFIFENILKIIF